MAWSVACIFILPTLVRDSETVNPLKLLRNSAGTLKRTWGELIIGFVGLELAFGLIFMVLLILAMLGAGIGRILSRAAISNGRLRGWYWGELARCCSSPFRFHGSAAS